MVELLEVESGDDEKFLAVADKVYAGDENWVKPLDVEIKAVFDPKRNSFFKIGEVRRWVLIENNVYVGRIAAFINHKLNKEKEVPEGGFGFFECIKSKDYAFQLFDKCKEWFSSKGIKAMQGPINFGENDNNWGLLVKGFTRPAYGMSYNPPYYRHFFEEYGFKPVYEQYTNHFNLKKGLPERFKKIGERVIANPKYHFKHFKIRDASSMLRDMEHVYNKAWKSHSDFQPIDYDYLLDSFDKMKSFLKEDLIWFAYAENQPIGFIVAIPDINQIIRDLNGKMNWISQLKFLYYRQRKVINRVRVLIMGISPEYQNKGIESGLINYLFDAAQSKSQYLEAELSWVGSFNSKMLALHKASGATLGKVHITYSYKFE